jgi:RNA methyltransferase, TrmH family
MKKELFITSGQNENVKEILALREKRERDASHHFLIEGYRELLRAVDVSWKIEKLFICEELFLGSNEGSLIKRIVAQGVPIYVCSRSVFEKFSYRDRPDGLLAIAKQKYHSLEDLAKKLNHKKSPLFVVAEAIEKPGNLGTILRSSDAVNADGLIVCDRCTDIYNPNVVRASIGTLFTVPVVESSSQDALAWLKQQGIAILAATPSGSLEFTQVNMKGPLAIAVGTEQLGLSELWMQQADVKTRIPMCGVADSLNVAMATTLLLYEALRQRQGNI